MTDKINGFVKIGLTSLMFFSIPSFSCMPGLRNMHHKESIEGCKTAYESGLYQAALEYCSEAVEMEFVDARRILGDTYVEMAREKMRLTADVQRDCIYFREINYLLENARDSYLGYLERAGDNEVKKDLRRVEILIKFNEIDYRQSRRM